MVRKRIVLCDEQSLSSLRLGKQYAKNLNEVLIRATFLQSDEFLRAPSNRHECEVTNVTHGPEQPSQQHEHSAASRPITQYGTAHKSIGSSALKGSC